MQSLCAAETERERERESEAKLGPGRTWLAGWLDQGLL